MPVIQQKLLRGPVILEDIHSSGRCIGRVGNKNIYLPESIPGENVTFTLERQKRGFYSGRIEEIIESSSHRVIPFCKHYHTCGGCNWQHIAYPAQLELKHRILCMALEKYGINTPEVPPVIPSPEIRYYRHRMEYAFSSHAYCETDGRIFSEAALGFHKTNEPGKVVSIQECHLQAEPVRSLCEFIVGYALDHQMDFFDPENKTGFLRSLSFRVNRNGEVMVVLGMAIDQPMQRNELLNVIMQKFPQVVSMNYTLHLSPMHSQLQGEIVTFGDTRPCLFETMAGYRFRMHAGSFFQPNVEQAEKIFLAAVEWADLKGSERVYDLYTGVGTIACFMASGARQVIGIEGSSGAVEDATENARINNLYNALFLEGDILETFKPAFLEEWGKANVIVLDPPRSGTLIEIKKTINSSGADKVLYLSCNPVSLAFDLKQLTEMYRVTRIQPYDMLPHTHHLETLVLLEHK